MTRVPTATSTSGRRPTRGRAPAASSWSSCATAATTGRTSGSGSPGRGVRREAVHGGLLSPDLAADRHLLGGERLEEAHALARDDLDADHGALLVEDDLG